MRKRSRSWSGACAALCFLLLAAGAAADTGDARNQRDFGSQEGLVSALERGAIDLDDLRALGLFVFTTPFGAGDGYGDGPFDPSEDDAVAPGQRPTLQGNGRFLRVNGLDAQSCNECHTLVSHATRPPTLGIGGAGPAVTNALILPSVIDVGDSTDPRVRPAQLGTLPLERDGVADFSGRFANPPFLFGGGAVELLAKEMTSDLQALLAQARAAPPGHVTPLVTHGVDFGELVTLEGGRIDLSRVEGVGPEDPTGHAPEEVLVVRPFGRKGESFSMRDFDRVAMQFHFGIQPVEVVDPEGRGGVDADGDGVADEIPVANMTALHVFDVTNPAPRQDRRGRDAHEGFRLFQEIGCAGCHRPALETRTRSLPVAYPEVAHDPWANVYLEIDLAETGLAPNGKGGLVVPLFADLKRHDMGDRLAESFERGEISNREFTTARLWGVADTAPYLHDGRALDLREAIELHGGEAQAACDAFLSLPPSGQRRLLDFLGTLRTPRRPNQELARRLDRRMREILAALGAR